jgi:hypothetical protein
MTVSVGESRGETDLRDGNGLCGVCPALVCGLVVPLACLSEYGAVEGGGAGESARGGAGESARGGAGESARGGAGESARGIPAYGGIGLRLLARGTSFDNG